MNGLVANQLEYIGVKSNPNEAPCAIQLISNDNGIEVFRVSIDSTKPFIPEPVIVEWKIPAINVKGVWKNTVDFAKRIEPDWELKNMESRISIDSPVMSLFGNQDENVLSFACSNAIDRIDLGAKYREEDNHFYCQMIFFMECPYEIENFSADILIDRRNIHFSKCLVNISQWWETYNMQPLQVPEIAKKPLYSTWYQYHQNLDPDELLGECRMAVDLGFDSIIIDDGWQTNDNNRGYDYTGDWLPERIPDMKQFVQSLQSTGIKVGLWYSVPFCGKKSKAYQRFKGKFLTETHRWAPVFDPRYPEVRQYLVDIYTSAVRDWGLDGLKLDFIDDFRRYEETSSAPQGKDFLSINEAVDTLLSEVLQETRAVNPDIFIEFRQRYIGPAIRKYGNMLRAFDCPGDYTMNRVRIADIKMLSGNTAVHSDMVTWHFDEPVEYAALQLINTLFGVPQVSMILKDIPQGHLEMIRFYVEYWRENADLFLDGDFLPTSPLSNYPIQTVKNEGKLIAGVYDDHHLTIEQTFENIDILNAKISTTITVIQNKETGHYRFEIFDCKGRLVSTDILDKGLSLLNIPSCGIVKMKLIN
ncbi:MAG: glycoside hydrolase family 36 protein [Bacteroidota bacterium]